MSIYIKTKIPRSAATIVANGKYTYFLTICKHQTKDYVTKQDLNNVITLLKLRNPTLVIETYIYEISPKYKQLHFHGTCTANKLICYKHNNSLLTYRVYWQRVYNLKTLTDYITKNVSNKYEQEQVLYTNWYNHHYGFDSETMPSKEVVI